jgi:hypothetical protein
MAAQVQAIRSPNRSGAHDCITHDCITHHASRITLLAQPI